VNANKELAFAAMGVNGGDPTGEQYEKNQDELQKPQTSCGGGVSSWNDLTDRPDGVGYTEMEVEFPEATLTYIPDFGNPMLSAIGVTGGFILDDFCPIRNENYEIVWNGVTYHCRPGVQYLADGVTYLVGMGNFAAFSGEGNTGEPFIIANMGSGATIAIPLDGNTSPVVEIKREVIHGIPEKYQVFNLDVYHSLDVWGTYVTYGQVRSALETGKHIVCRRAFYTNTELGNVTSYTYYHMAEMEYDGNPKSFIFVPLPYLDRKPNAIQVYVYGEYNDATVYKVNELSYTE
jgi:hypothetical protein